MRKGSVSKKNSGFSLLELIIVIAIMAVLIAILAPNLIGYVGKARNAKLTEECRQCVLAAQLIAIDRYALGELDSGDTEADVGFKAEIREVAGIPPESNVDYVKLFDASVTELSYTNGGKTVIYKDRQYTILEAGAQSGSQLPSGYTNASDPLLTAEEKQKAIEKNAQSIVATLNIALAEMLKNAAPDGNAAYLSNSNIAVNVVNPTAATGKLYDSNGNMIGDSSFALNLSQIMKELVQQQGIVTSSSNFGYTQVYFESAGKINGNNCYLPQVKSIRFKGVVTTGGATDEYYYTYDVATQTLTKS